MLMAEISALRRRPLDPGTHTTRFFDMQRDHVLAASQRPLSLSCSPYVYPITSKKLCNSTPTNNKKTPTLSIERWAASLKLFSYNHTSSTFTPCVCFDASAVAKDWRRRSLVPQLVASVSVTLIVVVERHERHEHHRQRRLIVTLIVGSFVCSILLCLQPTA